MNSEPVSFPFLFGLLIYLYTFLVLLFPIILIEVTLIYIILFVLGVISSNLCFYTIFTYHQSLYTIQRKTNTCWYLFYTSLLCGTQRKQKVKQNQICTTPTT